MIPRKNQAYPLPRRVRIVEVGPRDGLQNEPRTVPTPAKVGFLERLARSGLRDIECTSFVSPKAVPQLSDAEAVCAGLPRDPGVRWIALVPNLRGLERALRADIRALTVFTAASETFTRHNIRKSIDESLRAFEPVAQAAHREGLWLRAYVSTAFGCPYEGDVPVESVLSVTGRLFDLGVEEVSISDTIGVAVPSQVRDVTLRLLERFPAARLAMHFHDTRGTALANVLAAMELGIEVFDSSAGGLGGCPFAPGAGGNLATEDLLYMLDGMGIETGVSLDRVMEASRFLEHGMGRPFPSKVLRVGGAASCVAGVRATTPG